MALTTYAELKASIADWLRRTDLTARIPDFITLAEAQMRRRLRERPMQNVATASISAEYGETPGDFLTPISYTLTNGTLRSLDFISQERIDLLTVVTTDPREPESVAIVGGQFRYWPVPDQAYTAKLTYFRSIPALSSTTTSNWVLADHPDAYLYGALMQSAPFLKDDDRLATWGSLFRSVLEDMEASDHVSNQTTLRTDPGLQAVRRFDINTGR